MADLERLFKQIEQEKGKLDIVFANAGVAEYAPFGKVDEAQFDRLFDSNVKGMLFSVQKALPLMPDGGTIVLTGSVVGSKGFQANTVYAATKAARSAPLPSPKVIVPKQSLETRRPVLPSVAYSMMPSNC
jgi:NAD(P)-dependent dehydrogenase (short-subunit alcohol dehydrogenase family)